MGLIGRFTCHLLAPVCIVSATAARALAAPPEQFRVWGGAGPEFPPVPEGWTEELDPSEPLVPLRPTPEESRLGFVVFARDPFSPVSPRATPLPSERTGELKLFAARGEYEPASFCLHALKPLADVQVQATELRSTKGETIPADHVDVRFVRCVRVPRDAKAKTYRLQPFLLEKRKAISIPEGTSAQVWLTLKVPEKAQEGIYSGAVTVITAAGEAARLKLTVQVLPFTLPPAPIEMAMYYGHPPEPDELLLKEFTDLREHGINSLETAVGVQIRSRDRNFGDDDIAATRAHCKRMMDAMKKVFGGWRFPITFEVGHQIAYYWDPQKNWFVHWPHSPKIEADLFKAIDVVRELAKAEGWPPLRAYVMDEAGAHNLLDEAVYYYGLVKQRYPDMTTWTDIGGGIALGHDEIGQLNSVVDIFSTNRFTPEIAKALVARKKPYGVYNGAGHTLAGPRFFFGFYGFKTGASQIAQWVYHFGDSVFRGNGFRQEDEGYVYTSHEGPLPSLYWESVREGVDDYRYVTLLRQLSDRAGANKVGWATLQNILGQINWQFQALASSERTLPPHPATLRKWRWQVAQAIQALGPNELPTAPPPPPPSPFDLPWAEAAREEVSLGTELLPPSGFEEGMKPWRIEAWNGKGKGELDPTTAHSGKQSVRVDVPAESGNQAVTVLVWPSWGGSNVNVKLEGGRIYEFSAWVKLQGRSTPPSPRLSLPDGAAKSTREGKDVTGPDGWTRVWTRTEMAFPAVPKYLALWVQGPGTAWIDDLSLREVIPPPLRVSLDQAAYDGLDRVGVATINVSKLVSPAQVRFSLVSADGKVLGQLVSPFEALAAQPLPASGDAGLLLLAPASLRTCQLAFDPSKLPQGTWTARVELLDAAGKVMAAEAAKLEQLPD